MESFGTLHVFLPAAAACVLAVLPSCGKFALGAFDGRMRRLTDRPAPVSEMPSALPDTSVFVSAVRYDPGYNWIKDSLHGSVGFDIVLYDDGVPLLTVPVPVGAPFSASPDTHHIIDGSLYTEFPAADGTVICRDGMEILRLGSGERLLGLIPAQDGLYSLTVRQGGDGFVLRRDHEVLLSRGVGTVFGSFGEPSYGTTGALYRDDGSICFAYRETGGRVFTVRDGNESVVLPNLSGLYAGEMLDVKVRRERTAAGYSRVSGLSVEGTRVWPCPDGSFFLTCTVCGPDACSAALPYGVSRDPVRIGPPAGHIYYSPRGSHVIDDSQPAHVGIYSSAEGKTRIFRDCYLPDISCAAFSPSGRLVVAMASLDGSDTHPVFDSLGGEGFLEVHGYPSCVAICISPPS